MKTKKQPYAKQFNSMGNVINEITKETPYLHEAAPSRQMRRGHVRVIPLTIGNEMIFVTQRKAKSSGKWINVN